MSSLKLEREIKSLVKIGLTDDQAKIIIFHKYGYHKESEEIVNKLKEEQIELEEAVDQLTTFEESLQPYDESTIDLIKNENK